MATTASAISDLKTCGADHSRQCLSTPPVLQLVEHLQDPVSPVVSAPVTAHRSLTLSATPDAGAYQWIMQSFPEPIGIIATVTQ